MFIRIVIPKVNIVRCLLLHIINNFTITQHQLSFPVCSVLSAGQSSSILTSMFINIQQLEKAPICMFSFLKVPAQCMQSLLRLRTIVSAIKIKHWDHQLSDLFAKVHKTSSNIVNDIVQIEFKIGELLCRPAGIV